MSYWNNRVELTELAGEVISRIDGLEKGSEEVRVFTECGNEYLFYHDQDCCESVDLNDFEMSSDSLVGGTIISAEEIVNDDDGEKPSDWSESWRWTFYKIETDKGGLRMRWLGESNGYYSEFVDFIWVNKPE